MRLAATRKAPDVMTVEDVAAYLRIPKSSVYKLAQLAKIPSQKVGRHWRFRREALDRWLEANLGVPPAMTQRQGPDVRQRED